MGDSWHSWLKVLDLANPQWFRLSPTQIGLGVSTITYTDRVMYLDLGYVFQTWVQTTWNRLGGFNSLRGVEFYANDGELSVQDTPIPLWGSIRHKRPTRAGVKGVPSPLGLYPSTKVRSIPTANQGDITRKAGASQGLSFDTLFSYFNHAPHS